MATTIDRETPKDQEPAAQVQRPGLLMKILDGLYALVTSRFLRRRLVFYLIAGFAAITINFLIPRLMPGDPVQLMFARFQGRLDPRAMEALQAQFGFIDGPLWEQYLLYLRSVVTLDFGPSVMGFPVDATTIIWTSLRWTLLLAGTAALLSFLIGTLLGIMAAWRRGSPVDTILLPISSVLGAFPYFWIALLALYILGFQLDMFPTSHAYDTGLQQDWGSTTFLSSVFTHAVLPMITIVITATGSWMLGMRNNMIGILSQDYIVMAEAKGLSDRRIMLLYAARNAILPSLTAFAMSFGFVIGGALLTEIVFSYPGMGYTLLQAVNARDYPVMQGIFLMITATVLVANFIADMSYVLLDPRARSR
jgi:peptide/nickel transport system permease protein